MIGTLKAGLTLAVLAAALVPVAPAIAQDGMKRDGMKQDGMKQDGMKQDGMMHEEKAKALYTGKFHGKVHQTEGRATVYQQADGKLLLRLTNFKTSNGPDVHVVLVAFCANPSPPVSRSSGRPHSPSACRVLPAGCRS